MQKEEIMKRDLLYALQDLDDFIVGLVSEMCHGKPTEKDLKDLQTFTQKAQRFVELATVAQEIYNERKSSRALPHSD